MRSLVVAMLLAIAASSAHAQIVNVQGALARTPKPGWSGGLELAADWQTGPVDIVKVGGGASALFHTGPWLALVLARGEYSEGEDVKLAEKTFEHARARRDFDERWLWEAFLQHEYDAFRRLAVRAVAGTGPAFRISTHPRAAVVTGLAYLAELEQRSKLDGAADSGDRAYRHRLSAYVTGSFALSEGVTANQTTYIQPRLDARGDLMLLSETTFSSKLGKHVALINSFVVTYDADPPETVVELTTSLKIGIAVSFP